MGYWTVKIPVKNPCPIILDVENDSKEVTAEKWKQIKKWWSDKTEQWWKDHPEYKEDYSFWNPISNIPEAYGLPIIGRK